MPLPAAAAIGAGALKWLPAIGAVGGALPGLRKGNLGEAALGSGLGALTGYGSVGGLGALTKSGMRMAGGMGAQNVLGTAAGQIGGLGAQKAVMGALTPGVLTSAARAGIPALGAAGVFGASGGLAGAGGPGIAGGGGNVLGGLAKGMQGQGNLVPLSSLPAGYQPDANSMVRGPEGNWWYQMNPGGVAEGNRLGRMRDAQTDASNINTIGNALYGQTERVARSEFERQAAASQLKANIEQAKAMALNSQTAGLQIGMDAGQGMANAMSNRSNFRYL